MSKGDAASLIWKNQGSSTVGQKQEQENRIEFAANFGRNMKPDFGNKFADIGYPKGPGNSKA